MVSFVHNPVSVLQDNYAPMRKGRCEVWEAWRTCRDEIRRLARRVRGLRPGEVCEAISQHDAEEETPPDEVEADQDCGIEITM